MICGQLLARRQRVTLAVLVGETIIIASTEGNIAVPELEEKIGLNVYRRK